MKNLTLIIPTKKEVESLPVFLNELKNYKCKKMIVMQKEDLATFNKIKKIKNIKIIKQKKRGYGNALIEGIKAVKTKYCCIINADGSMNPKYLKRMFIRKKLKVLAQFVERRRIMRSGDLVFQLLI